MKLAQVRGRIQRRKPGQRALLKLGVDAPRPAGFEQLAKRRVFPTADHYVSPLR
jgi:hypothetical protein